MNAHTAVITKADLLPYVDVDVNVMKRYIAEINPKVVVFETALKNGLYEAEQLVEYILEQVREKQRK